MAPTLVATVGASDANSFALQSEGDTYCDARLNASAWTNAATADKDRALIEATREINVLRFVGSPVTDTQALVWPRQWAVDPDAAWPGTYYATTELPQRVKDATCELALQFLKAGTTDIASLDATQGVKRKKTDVLETEWFEGYQQAVGLAQYPRVLAFLKPLLVSAGNSVPLVRG